jgi:hypothetical protein
MMSLSNLCVRRKTRKISVRQKLIRHQLPIAILILATFLDIITTIVGKHFGAIEANNLLSGIDNNNLIVFKLTAVILIVAWYLIRAEDKHQWQIWLIAGIYSLVPIFNIVTIFITLR